MSALWGVILFIVGLLVGVLIGWFVWGRKAQTSEERVRELEGKLRERDGQVKRLESRAADAESKAEALDARVQEAEGKVEALNSSVQEAEGKAEALEARAQEAEGKVEALEASAQALEAAANPDDLTRLEGIGPKMQSLLRGADVYTYRQLAVADVEQLQQMLRDAGLAMTDPSSWPEQAKLAAEAKWDELQVLQDNLKGGRRA